MAALRRRRRSSPSRSRSSPSRRWRACARANATRSRCCGGCCGVSGRRRYREQLSSRMRPCRTHSSLGFITPRVGDADVRQSASASAIGSDVCSAGTSPASTTLRCQVKRSVGSPKAKAVRSGSQGRWPRRPLGSRTRPDLGGSLFGGGRPAKTPVRCRGLLAGPLLVNAAGFFVNGRVDAVPQSCLRERGGAEGVPDNRVVEHETERATADRPGDGG